MRLVLFIVIAVLLLGTAVTLAIFWFLLKFIIVAAIIFLVIGAVIYAKTKK